MNECISDHADFKERGGQALFVIELTNACDRRIRCVVDAYVTTAKGPTSGHATLTLPGIGRRDEIPRDEDRAGVGHGQHVAKLPVRLGVAGANVSAMPFA